MVALHHLPKTLDLLWLRLLDLRQMQAEAVAEILALPPDHPYRRETLQHLAVLQVQGKAK